MTGKQSKELDSSINFDIIFPKLNNAMLNYKKILDVEGDFGTGYTDADELI
mgnify:CR=1 FL=1